MTIKEKATALRDELKKLGYNNRKISIKSGYCSYSDYIDITIKFEVEGNPRENEDIVRIKNISKKYDEIDRCEVTGEILAGGNTFINVWYNSHYI